MRIYLNFSTDKGLKKTVIPKFQFDAGETYSITIQVDVDLVIVRQGMFEIAREKVGRILPSTAAELQMAGDW